MKKERWSSLHRLIHHVINVKNLPTAPLSLREAPGGVLAQHTHAGTHQKQDQQHNNTAKSWHSANAHREDHHHLETTERKKTRKKSVHDEGVEEVGCACDSGCERIDASSMLWSHNVVNDDDDASISQHTPSNKHNQHNFVFVEAPCLLYRCPLLHRIQHMRPSAPHKHTESILLRR